MYDYLIVGSGLAGAVFAFEATKRGKKCLVLERRNHFGGNVYCDNIEGINVHKYGAHIFHSNNEKIWNYVNEITRFNNFVNSPIARYKDEVYNLPFNMNTFSKMWGIFSPKEAIEIIDRQKQKITSKPENLEEQAISLVGTDIYEKLIKGYTEKQWGRACIDLPVFIINRIPVRFTYDNNYYDMKFQGIPQGGYNCLFDKFFKNCEIVLEKDYICNRENYNSLAKKVLYTGNIDTFYDYCFGELQYRSLRFEHKVYNIANYQGVAVVNYTDNNIPYTRSIEHKHFESSNNKKTVVSYEYPLEWSKDIEAYYPVNDEKNQKKYHQYESLAQKEKNVIFCGRLAQYKYLNMSDTIEEALKKVEKEFSNN